jgi:hypothetical protein
MKLFNAPTPTHIPRRFNMPEWLIFVLILVAWIALQAWILPRFGIST